MKATESNCFNCYLNLFSESWLKPAYLVYNCIRVNNTKQGMRSLSLAQLNLGFLAKAKDALILR